MGENARMGSFRPGARRCTIRGREELILSSKIAFYMPLITLSFRAITHFYEILQNECGTSTITRAFSGAFTSPLAYTYATQRDPMSLMSRKFFREVSARSASCTAPELPEENVLSETTSRFFLGFYVYNLKRRIHIQDILSSYNLDSWIHLILYRWKVPRFSIPKMKFPSQSHLFCLVQHCACNYLSLDFLSSQSYC